MKILIEDNFSDDIDCEEYLQFPDCDEEFSDENLEKECLRV